MSTGRAPIAVVGISALFPGSRDVDGFWRDVLEGRDRIVEVPASHWLTADYFDADASAEDKTYCRRGGFLDAIDFDCMAFGLPPNLLPATDTSQLLALIAAHRALEDARQGRAEHVDRKRTSVILGSTGTTELVVHMGGRLERPLWLQALREAGIDEPRAQAIAQRIADLHTPWSEATFPGFLGNVIAGRIANRFDLGGTNCVVDAACASSLAALAMAVAELRDGRSDLVLTGGVDTLNDILMFVAFSKTPALSPSGDCRPFASDADGTLLGEGLGMVALRRLADAERDGDRIYAVIHGIGASSDGRARSVYAPAPDGQASALARAYEDAGYTPRTVELVEAHGTATVAGDRAELEGLTRVFAFADDDATPEAWCALGSVKSQIGHTKGAAGVASLLKVVLALHEKVLPPTIKVERPNPGLEGTPFYVNARTRPWIRAADHPRRASVSSFGFGGSNFHVTLEEYPRIEESPRRRPAPAELLLWSAADAPALADRLRALAAGLSEHDSLQELARDAARRFDSREPVRLAVVAAEIADLREHLAPVGEHLRDNPDTPASSPRGWYYGRGAHDGSVAFLFPGQGSQYVGMGTDLAVGFDQARAVWDRAAAAPQAGALHGIVFPAAAFDDEQRAAQTARLTATETAQPALGLASLSCLEVLRWLGVDAQVMGGHSYGEVTALCAAGAYPVDALVRIARRRGELIAGAATQAGAMCAVFAPATRVAELLAGVDTAVVIANDNGPGQCVVSGACAEIERVQTALQAAGMGVQRLAVATAFHSPLVASARAPFRDFLDGETLEVPSVPVFANASAAPYPDAVDSIREILASQIALPVRFHDQVQAMYAQGVRTFVEVGPDGVLSRLVDDCLGDRPHLAVATDRRGRHGLTALWHALGALAAAGIALRSERLWEGVDAAPSHPKPDGRLVVPITGVNHAKPYPANVAAGRGSAATQVSPPDQRHAPPSPPARAVQAPSSRQDPLPATPAPSASAGGKHPDAPNTAGGTHANAAIAAIRDLQRDTAAAHSEYLRVAGLALSQLEQLLGPATAAPPAVAGESGAVGPSQAAIPPAQEAPLPPVVDAHRPSEYPAAPRLAPRASGAPRYAVESSPTAVNAPRAAPDHVPPPVSPTAPRDLVSLLLEVVAEKTGYPPELLEVDMSLEADLGIDSIKRVEILSALLDRAPEIGAMEPTELARLDTLRAVADYASARVGDGALTPVADRSPTPAEPTPADFGAELLAVVADKTGYPPEMLELGMDLEADLGVDSIKRVEILSALQDRLPALPDLDPSRLAGLRTLADIVASLDGPATSAAVSEPPKPAVVTDSARAVHGPALERREVRFVECEASDFLTPGLEPGCRVEVLDDGAGVAPALVACLIAQGMDAHVAGHWDGRASRIVSLRAWHAERAEPKAAARDAFDLATRFASVAAAGPATLVLVEDSADGGAGLAGLARTARLEWPAATVRALDVERGGRGNDAIASAIAAELLAGGAEPVVRLCGDGRRLVPTSVSVAVARQASGGLGPLDVVVVSGGARGVTAASVVELARRSRSRFALLGRTVPATDPDWAHGIAGDAALKKAALQAARDAGRTPSPRELAHEVAAVESRRELESTLDAIREAGAEASYFALDVRDAAAVERALSEVRERFGPVTALVHGAGVICDRHLADASLEEFDQVFDTKVTGLRNLLGETAADPVHRLCLFSSLSAFSGNVGQGAYAMANEVLNRIAEAEAERRGAACLVRSIGWGPWDSGMVNPALRAQFEDRGVPLITLERGAEALAEEFDGAPGGPAELLILAAGGALHPTGLQGCLRASVALGAATHAWLADHAVAAAPVVPLALVLDWFARAVRWVAPACEAVRLHDLRVLRGIELPAFDVHPECFCIELEVEPAGLTTRLCDADGTVRYRAGAEIVSAGALAAQAPSPEALLPVTDDGDGKTLYEEVLFHGPRFQALASQVDLNSAGGRARIVGLRELDWPRQSWFIDPAAIDAGLQIAVVWDAGERGLRTLPMGVDEALVLRTGPLAGPADCVQDGNAHNASASRSDLVYRDADGRPFALLRGVRTFAVGPAAGAEPSMEPTDALALTAK